MTRFLATVRSLKLIQITNRVTRRLFPTVVRRVIAARREAVIGAWVRPITSKRITLQGTARFLNEGRSLDLANVWNDPSASKLWLYQLHYFDGLAAAAESDGPMASSLLERWIRENPPADGVGWEPFPVSLRVCNWIKFAMQGGTLSQAALDSMATQVAWLDGRLEYHLLGNHLLHNACALFAAGCFLGGKDAERWRLEGARLIDEEVREQILPDGMHFELSAMYQLLVLEALLDVVNVAQAFGHRVPADLRAVCKSMLEALDTLTHPDGNIVQFNDAALHQAPTRMELADYAKRLEIEPEVRSRDESSWLPDAGYARLVGDGAVAFVDVAEIGPSYLPAHAHADTLTFELSVRGRRTIVDTGISTYAVGQVRHLERGTPAHNTLTIDGRNSSDVWHAFRVGDRAHIVQRSFQLNSAASIVQGAHDGYRRRGVVHTRRWSMHARHMDVTDKIAGCGEHSIECAFHLHPGLCADVRSGVAYIVDGQQNSILSIALDPKLVWSIAEFEYHPDFGISHRGLRLQGRGTANLPCELSHAFRWD